MAIYRPDLAGLDRQLATILAQEAVDVRVFGFVDGPMDQQVDVLAQFAADERLQCVTWPKNLGSAPTFMQGLAQALEDPWVQEMRPYFAFADQDDAWDTDKLSTLVHQMQTTGCSVVHSDARLVDEKAHLIANSLFDFERREKRSSLMAAYFRNNVTGMTMAFDHETASAAVGFRDCRPAPWYHDQFVAMVGAARNGIGFVDRPLASYVQHGSNVVGAKAPGRRIDRIRAILSGTVETRQYLEEGKVFLDAILNSSWPTPEGRARLARIQQVYDRTGVAGVLRAVGMLSHTRLTNPLSTKLFLDKFRELVPLR